MLLTSLVLFVGFDAALFTLAVPATASATSDLKFYMQGHFTNIHTFAAAPLVSYMSNETLVGVLTAFHEVNAAGGLAGGRNLTLKLFDDKGHPGAWAANSTVQMNDPSLLGAVTAKANDAFFVNPIARQFQMPVFGPTTVDQTELAQSTPNSDFLIHARVPILSDTIAELNYAMSGEMHCRNFLIVFLDAYGIRNVADEIIDEMDRLGLPAPVVVGVNFQDSGNPAVLVPLVMSKYLAAVEKPTCAILMVHATAAFPLVLGMSAALPPDVFADFHFFGTSAVMNPRWVDPATGSGAAFKNLYITSSHPSGTDTRFEFIKHYQRAMAVFKENRSSPVLSTFAPNVFGVDGYMAARMLIEAIRRVGIGEQVTRQRLKDVVYETKMFQIDDIVLGPFSNGCVGQQTAKTGACWCTAGMKQIFLSRVDPATGFTVPVFDSPHFPNLAQVPIPLAQCNLKAKVTLRRPILVMTARDVNLGVVAGSTDSFGNFSDSNPTVKMQSRSTEHLRAAVLTAMNAQALVSGPLLAVPFTTKPASASDPLTSSAVTFTNETLKTVDVRYRPAFLMGAVYDPVKVYPQLSEMNGQSIGQSIIETQSPSSTLPVATAVSTTTADVVHVLDIAPATSAFPDQDEPWRPPAAHLPLRIPFYPTLADLAVTAAAFAANRLGLKSSNADVTVAKISIIADTNTLASIGTKSVETVSRASPASVKVMPMETTATSEAELDTIIENAASEAKNGATSPPTSAGQSSQLSVAVVVITRKATVLNAVLRVAAKSEYETTTAFLIAADEFVLEEVIAARSVASTSISTPTNVFFTSGLPRYTTSASPDDFRVSATESYGSAIAATVKALFDLSGKTNGSAVEIATEAYRNLAVPVAAAEISLSPLWAEKCTNIKAPTWPHPGGECQCAKGLNTFFVRSFKDAVVNSTGRGDFSYRHSGCGPAFRALDPAAGSSGLSTTELVLIVAGAALFMLVSAAAVMGAWMAFCQRSTRDNSNAPTDSDEPFTIVFTDIQASTRLWAHAPDRMGEALDVHHRLMREAIKRRRGYEVKTIGDSFMVAFQHPHDALRFAFDTQFMLYSHDMDTDVFDDVYKKATEEAMETSSMDEVFNAVLSENELKSGPPSPSQLNSRRVSQQSSQHWAPGMPHGELPIPGHSGSEAPMSSDQKVDLSGHNVGHRSDGKQRHQTLSPEDYAALWSGLRVRIGIHHGTGSIRLDETSQGYDYYGTVVNTAARVEGVGHGGQILATGAVYACFGDEALSKLQVDATDLGLQPLRGLPEPVRLFQLLPDAFSERVFPPLRLDVENEVENDESAIATGDGSGNDGDTRRGSAGTDTVFSGQRLATSEVVADLTKKLRLRSPTASRLSIAAAFDAVSTLLAAMKPAGRRETLKALSAAWRVHGVWSGPHMRRLERASALSTEQLTLLATVGRAVQALEVQIRSSEHLNTGADLPSKSPATGNGQTINATPRASGFTTTPRGAVGDAPSSAVPRDSATALSASRRKSDYFVGENGHDSNAPKRHGNRMTAAEREKAELKFTPGQGYDTVLQVLKAATAASSSPEAPLVEQRVSETPQISELDVSGRSAPLTTNLPRL